MPPVHPDDLPVTDTEVLLRRVPSDPARFVYPNGPFQWQAFLPNSNDDDGLSVNREGDQYETADSLRAKAANEQIRLYGGVVAIEASVPRGLGADVTPDRQEDSRGHCFLARLSRKAYTANKRAVKSLADEMARSTKCFVRIAPLAVPPVETKADGG
jgi:hypothetical protein